MKAQAGMGRGVARGSRAGFTLIEVMIVIAIILALTGLVGVALFTRSKDAKKDMAKIDINNITSAMDFFRHDFDRYPKDEEGVAVLWDKAKLDPEADAGKWHEYLKAPLINDRWDHPWGYRQVSEHGDDATKFDLWSYGPDGQEGTDDDITSWAGTGADGATGGADGAPPPAKGKGG